MDFFMDFDVKNITMREEELLFKQSKELCRALEECKLPMLGNKEDLGVRDESKLKDVVISIVDMIEERVERRSKDMPQNYNNLLPKWEKVCSLAMSYDQEFDRKEVLTVLLKEWEGGINLLNESLYPKDRYPLFLDENLKKVLGELLEGLKKRNGSEIVVSEVPLSGGGEKERCW